MTTLFIEGRLGADAEVEKSKNGNSYVKLNVASTEQKKDNNEVTYWYRVIFFQGISDNLLKHLTKGKSVVIVANNLEEEIYDTKTGDKAISRSVIGCSIHFQEGRKEESGNTTATTTPTSGQGNANLMSGASFGKTTTAQPAPAPATKPVTTSPVSKGVDDENELPF